MIYTLLMGLHDSIKLDNLTGLSTYITNPTPVVLYWTGWKKGLDDSAHPSELGLRGPTGPIPKEP